MNEKSKMQLFNFTQPIKFAMKEKKFYFGLQIRLGHYPIKFFDRDPI